MAIRITLAFFAIFLTSCSTDVDVYDLEIKCLDDKRTSVVELIRNKRRIDFIDLGDYYCKNKITKLDNHVWHISHNVRCGSDCIMSTQYVFMIKDDQLIKALHLPLSNNEPDYQDSLYLEQYSKESLVFKYMYQSKEDVGEIISKEYVLNLNEDNKTYYNSNTVFKKDSLQCISINNEIYVYENNNWFYNENDTLIRVNSGL